MLAHTESVTLEAPFSVAYPFLSNPENLPRWAHVFCQDIEKQESEWLAQTVAGPLIIRYACDAASGTIDIVSRLDPGVEDIAYTRLMPNGPGCEFTFTFFRTADMSDEIFDSQRWGLREEMRALRAIFRELVG